MSFAAIRSGEAAGGSLIAEERIVLGLIASSPLQSTVKDMAGHKEYSAVDMLALANEVCGVVLVCVEWCWCVCGVVLV